MKRRLCAMFICLGLAAVLAAAQQVRATLGESVVSIQSDRKALSAVQRGTAIQNGFTVQEMKSGSTTVREYISPSGVVFGVAWNGLMRPDLTQLLGAYSNEYHEALRRIPHNRGRSHLDVKTNRVVVQQWGHMRNLRGRAYVPSLIPSGVSVDEIR
jgi:uncharacterized protein DUF2844